MKNVRRISKKYYLRQIMACWMILCMSIVMPVRIAMAAATPVVSNPGGADITQNGDTFVVVDQLETVIGWSNFNTNINEIVDFAQADGINNAAVLNRISGGLTTYNGRLIAEKGMSIFLLNPAGIVFGPDSYVSVTNLIASGMTLDDDLDSDYFNAMNTGTYNFTGGAGAGDIENHGDMNADMMIALIGKTVLNTGTIDADYVAIAAGDTVTITGATGDFSNINVQVAILPENLVNIGAYYINNSGEIGKTSVKRVILAAGDIWSSAYIGADGDGVASVRLDAIGKIGVYGKINVTAGKGSSSEATVDIIAGGDINITDSVKVEAENYSGVAADDAIATITINSKEGNVLVQGPGTKLDAKATTGKGGDFNTGSGNAEATIDIDAGGKVDIIKVDVKTVAKATDSGDATATINVNAAGGDATILKKPIPETLKAEATADGAGNALADIDVIASGSVILEDEVKATATAKNGAGTAVADILIDAGGEIVEDKGIKADAKSQNGSGSATSKIVVDAGGSVESNKKIESKASVENAAEAAAAIATIDIDSGVGSDVIINKDVKADAKNESSGNATATVDIGSGGNIYIGGDNTVKATADALGDGGDADATLNAAATVNITADGDVEIYDKVEAASHAREGAGSATSTVNVLAGGNITVDAGIKAGGAHTNDEAGPANANITLDADGDVTITSSGKLKTDAHANDNSEDAGSTIDIDAGGAVDIDGDIEAKAHTDNNADDATVNVTIDAGTDVTIDGKIKVDAHANSNAGNASATLEINAGGDVIVDDYTAGVKARADDDAGNATATFTVNAANLMVIDGGEISVEAYTDGDSGDATATVDITLTSSDVIVDDGEIYAYAESDDSGDADATININNAENVVVISGGNITAETEVDNYGGPGGSSSSATSAINIDASGDVIVDEDSEIVADADLDNWDNWMINTFTGDADADVTITAAGEVLIDGLVKAEADVYNYDDYDENGGDGSFDGDLYQGNSSANVTIDNTVDGTGLGVTIGPDGEVIADSAFINRDYPAQPYENNVYSGVASAGIDIESCDDVIIDGLVSAIAFIDPVGTSDANPGNDDYLQTMDADVIIKAFGDIIVNSRVGEFEAPPSNGRIEALAYDGYENTADVILLAKSDVIINDRGCDDCENNYDDDLEVLAEASGGFTNNAHIGIATRDSVPETLLDRGEGDIVVGGQILARASDAHDEDDSSNTASVEISAARDVIVEGGYALYGEDDGPFLIEDEEGGMIKASASNGYFNSADIDVLAGRDIIVEAVEVEFTDELLKPEWDECDYSGGWIVANTHDGFENTSGVDLYAQRDVIIEGADAGDRESDPSDDGRVFAQSMNGDTNTSEVGLYAHNDVVIDGMVKAGARNGNENTATVKVKALGEIAGSGDVYAKGNEGSSSIIFDTPADNFVGFTNIDRVEGDLDFPEMEFDWIDWTWCAECEDIFIPAAPLYQIEIVPMIEGCPQLVQAAAMELGVTGETIQVAMGDALAMNPSIQACDSCAALVDAANVLRDVDGSGMAAMVAAFNALAPADAPFTPATAASIATAFEDAAVGSQYASAVGYIDAFVQYVAVLDTGLGSPVGDSVAFVMDKYGAGVSGSDNANIASFVAMRLAAIGQ